MTPKKLISYLIFAISNRFPVLITGAPGIGKSDIAEQAAKQAGAKLLLSHPVVSDPTDYKGLPFASKDGKAKFLPFEELQKLIDADSPLVYFIDDLGQAPPSVQAAVMQLILSRKINGFKISDHVTFIAATNRKKDKAAVSGILEPVKSRFASIVELEVSSDDWVEWAINNNMPIELIAFIRFKPNLLNDFKPTTEMINSPSPRTVANLGRQQAANLPKELEAEVFKGAAGEGFATEYLAFMDLFRNMPNVDKIILDPTGADVPTQPGILYGLSGALAHRMKEDNIDAIVTYLDRIPGEFSLLCLQDAIKRKPQLTDTRGFIKFSTGKFGSIAL